MLLRTVFTWYHDSKIFDEILADSTTPISSFSCMVFRIQCVREFKGYRRRDAANPGPARSGVQTDVRRTSRVHRSWANMEGLREASTRGVRSLMQEATARYCTECGFFYFPNSRYYRDCSDKTRMYMCGEKINAVINKSEWKLLPPDDGD